VVRAGIAFLLLVLTTPANACADWLLIPFAGSTFAGQSPAVVPLSEAASHKHWMLGGSAAWLTDGVFGLEADFAFVPGMFDSENALVPVEGSYAFTLGGNLIAAAPLSVTGDSLRPYLIGGLGLAQFSQRDPNCLIDCVTFTESALQVGGGAIGMLSDRTGVRFDLRQVRTLRRGKTLLGEPVPRLSFWRATLGVVIRY
jgi:hypothetical protein